MTALQLFSSGKAENEPEIRQPRRIFLHIASRAPAYRNKRLIETTYAVFELITMAATINCPFVRTMLTLLSNVTQNPAAHESEAGAIYCCLPPSKAKNGSETRHDSAAFIDLCKAELERFSNSG